jgi:hypothetical protein
MSTRTVFQKVVLSFLCNKAENRELFLISLFLDELSFFRMICVPPALPQEELDWRFRRST